MNADKDGIGRLRVREDAKLFSTPLDNLRNSIRAHNRYKIFDSLGEVSVEKTNSGRAAFRRAINMASTAYDASVRKTKSPNAQVIYEKRPAENGLDVAVLIIEQKTYDGLQSG